MEYRTDCREFKGDRPCYPYARCAGCEKYDRVSTRVLILKTGGLGDVLRTTPLLRGLQKKYGRGLHVTWLTNPESIPLLERTKAIDVLLPLTVENAYSLELMEFDLVISLEKERLPLAVATKVRAKEKKGFLLSASGHVAPADRDARLLYNLGLDDEAKFRKNRRTYQQLIFEACGLTFEGEEYILEIPDEALSRARAKFSSWDIGFNENVIGLNLGASSSFITKRWPYENFRRLADLIHEKDLGKVLLLGGPMEESLEKNMETGESLLYAGFAYPLLEFASLLSLCQVVVAADTLAMHLAIAMKVPVVALFGPTVAAEIDFYNRGTAISAEMECAPCFRKTCPRSPACMNTITPEKVLAEIEKLLAHISKERKWLSST